MSEDQNATPAVPAEPATPASTWLRHKRLILAAALVIATLLLYCPVLHHQFINFDDPMYVTLNANVNSGLSLQHIAWAFSTFEMGHWHPLTWLSHMLDCQLFQLDPACHHAVNLLFHAANALLLFLLLARATGAPWRSFFVAALFAFHPLNVESVAWVAERKTLLSAFFSFLMLFAYGWYAERTSWKRYLVVVATFLLALMAKAMAVTIPVVLLLVDFWPLRRFAPEADEMHSGDRTSATKLIAEKIPLLALSAIFSYLAVMAQRSTDTLNTKQPLIEHLKNAAVAYVSYLQKAFWPSGLSIFYPLSPQATAWPHVIVALFVLAAVTALVLRLRSERFLLTAWLYFLVTLLPVIGIVQVGGQLTADRYAYTPLIGIFIIVVWGIERLSRRWLISPVTVAVVALFIFAALGATTRATLENWQSGLTLFSRAEQIVGPNDSVIETNLGQAYDQAGQPQQAYQHLKHACDIAPQNSLVLGTFLVRHGQLQESIPVLQTAVKYSESEPAIESSLHNLATAYLLIGDAPNAILYYTQVLQKNPSRLTSWIGRGQADYRAGQFGNAANDFARAAQIVPDPQFFLLLGDALSADHRYQQAAAAYTEALKMPSAAAEASTRINALRKYLPAQ
jgi:Flp pilus assembly protein TadD